MKSKKKTAPKNTSSKKTVRKFRAPIVRLGNGLGWRVVYLPFSVKEVFGSGARLPVRGTANGAPFRTSLFPVGSGRHMLHLNKQVLAGAGVGEVGDMVHVVVEHDTEERVLDVPPLVKKTFSEDKRLWRFFESWNYSNRKEIVSRIMEPKSAEARTRRAEQYAMVLYQTMEGEHEAPPILKAEFAENPKAKTGWDRMSATHRRQHLWGIFYYQNPESRARRVEKAVQKMLEYAGKKKTAVPIEDD